MTQPLCSQNVVPILPSLEMKWGRRGDSSEGVGPHTTLRWGQRSWRSFGDRSEGLHLVCRLGRRGPGQVRVAFLTEGESLGDGLGVGGKGSVYCSRSQRKASQPDTQDCGQQSWAEQCQSLREKKTCATWFEWMQTHQQYFQNLLFGSSHCQLRELLSVTVSLNQVTTLNYFQLN